MGTAGLALFFVSGYSLEPAPPPRMTAITLEVALLPPSDRICGEPRITFSPFSFVTTSAVTPSLAARAWPRAARRGNPLARHAREATLLFEEHDTC